MPDSLPPSQDWVVIAHLGKTRGLKGELYGRGGSIVERLESLRSVRLRRTDGSFVEDGRPFEIEEARPYKDGLVFRFAGVDSIDAAEPLAHCELVIPAADRPALEDGEFYFSDLVGCVVFDRQSGRKVGTVTGWQEFGGPELLEVEPEGSRSGDVVWIPLVHSICVEIDTAAKRIVVDPPEGLLELNQGGAAG